MSLSITGLAQIAIVVHDIDRSIAFYRDVLGLRFLFQASPGLAFLECGGVRLMFALPETRALDHPNSILYFKVSDIQGSWTELAAAGATTEHGPHIIAQLGAVDVWLAEFRDPEGNILALMSEVAR
jgi:methylmalonyl-CoA/ethylmalonyl-CoA epimerase